MFIVLALHFELIFCLLTLPKCNLRKVKKSVDFDFFRLYSKFYC